MGPSLSWCGQRRQSRQEILHATVAGRVIPAPARNVDLRHLAKRLLLDLSQRRQGIDGKASHLTRRFERGQGAQDLLVGVQR